MIATNRISSSMALCVLGCLSFISTAFADTAVEQTSTTNAPQTTSDVSGTYLCNYHDPIFSTPPDGTELLVIKKISDTHYKMSKRGVNDTTPTIIGVGIPSNGQNNVLSFLFWRPTNPNSTFVQYIIVKPDGTLQGSWAVSNQNGTATFNCKKTTS